MKAKLLLQILVRKGVGWDDPLEEDGREQWRRWLEDLPAVFGDTVEIQVHLFYDTSRSGYSAVAFIRLTDSDKQVYSAFVMGKAMLAQIREISIPRLELTAAVVSVKHSRKEGIDLKIERIIYWTDSVLKCIIITMDGNRLTVIHNGSETNEW